MRRQVPQHVFVWSTPAAYVLTRRSSRGLVSQGPPGAAVHHLWRIRLSTGQHIPHCRPRSHPDHVHWGANCERLGSNLFPLDGMAQPPKQAEYMAGKNLILYVGSQLPCLSHLNLRWLQRSYSAASLCSAATEQMRNSVEWHIGQSIIIHNVSHGGSLEGDLLPVAYGTSRPRTFGSCSSLAEPHGNPIGAGAHPWESASLSPFRLPDHKRVRLPICLPDIIIHHSATRVPEPEVRFDEKPDCCFLVP